MKKLALALSVIIITFAAQAQDKMKNSKVPHLSFGVDGGAPLGKNSPIFNFTIGGDLQLIYNLAEHLDATGSVGFDARLYKGGVVKTDYYVPLLAGLRFSFSDKVYISEQAGYSIAATKALTNAITDVTGIGYKPSPKSDILVGYKGLFYSGNGNTFSCFEVRVGISFGK